LTGSCCKAQAKLRGLHRVLQGLPFLLSGMEITNVLKFIQFSYIHCVSAEKTV